jgi:DNA-binding response OmpR family regulator
MESILIIDDEYFALHKMKLAMSHHGLSGLEEARTGNYDLILLDVMLPGIDGLEVLRLLRNVSDVSILLLTARSEIDDRVNGLENGADDYVAKPFNPRELVARIRSILRRRAMSAMDVVVRTGNRKISVHGFQLDIMARSAEYRGASLSLTETEFSLLEALLESPGVVLGRELLSDRISQRPFHPLDRSLDMLVCRLRRKLDIQDNPGQAIRTIRSNGYVFMLPEKKVSRPLMLNGRTLESA